VRQGSAHRTEHGLLPYVGESRRALRGSRPCVQPAAGGQQEQGPLRIQGQPLQVADHRSGEGHWGPDDAARAADFHLLGGRADERLQLRSDRGDVIFGTLAKSLEPASINVTKTLEGRVALRSLEVGS
jgi:hypothetical protein